MPMTETYVSIEPARGDVDAFAGATLLEFGAPWCGFCRSAQPLISQAFAGHDAVRHLKIEDGSGLPLGRSFGVKLWPTLVFMRDGKELGRLVRPTSVDAIARALELIDSPAQEEAD